MCSNPPGKLIFMSWEVVITMSGASKWLWLAQWTPSTKKLSKIFNYFYKMLNEDCTSGVFLLFYGFVQLWRCCKLKLIYSIVIAQYNHIFYMHHCYFYCNEITVVSIDDESIVFYIFFTNMPPTLKRRALWCHLCALNS